MNATPDSGQGRFVWPPGPAAASPTTAADRPARRPVLDAIEAVEREWFGLQTLAFARRAELEGWLPDPADAYCRRCGGTVGPYEVSEAGCADCRGRRLPWTQLVRLGAYDGLVREAIHELKFHAWRRCGSELGKALGLEAARLSAASGLGPKEAALVPVPTTFRRRMARGVDHTLVLARSIRTVTGYPIVRALRRTHRPSQTQVPASARARNIAGSIGIRSWPLWRLSGCRALRAAIVVDDVTTTGATLRASCRTLAAALRRSGRPDVQVWVAVAGVSGGGTRRRENGPERPAPANGAVLA